MAPVVSVIIPVARIGPMLSVCLQHLAAQTFRDFDVWVVPDDDDGVPAGANVRTLVSGAVLPNRKRELAARATTAAIVAFIDDDAYPDPQWLAAALEHFADPGVVAVGGPGVTTPDATPRERASGAIFGSALVTAATRNRYVPGRQRDVDALPSCNLLMRRDLFLRDVGASAGEWPGEDIISCLYARRGGGRIVYDPKVLVYHRRRALFGPHLRQVWRYGRFRGRFLRRFGRPWRNAAYVVPALFVVAHAFAAAAFARRRARPYVLAAAAGYALLVSATAVSEASAARANASLVALGIYLTHVMYGIGTIAGFVRRSGDRDD